MEKKEKSWKKKRKWLLVLPHDALEIDHEAVEAVSQRERNLTALLLPAISNQRRQSKRSNVDIQEVKAPEKMVSVSEPSRRWFYRVGPS